MNFSFLMKNNPIIAGIARLYSQSMVLAEKTIIVNDVLMPFMPSHASKTEMQTPPRTAISVIVIYGITVIKRYVIIIGIIASK